MGDDATRIVATGYDEVAEEYLRWTSGSPLRVRQLEALLSALPTSARVLDLGCGAGIPLAPLLTDRGHRVVGVDGSKRQIALACETEPRGEFIVADMTTVEFAPDSFDAITALYSITHVPRDLHLALFRRIFAWLKPGGAFLASLGSHDAPSWTGTWLGTTMHFSHFDAETNLGLIQSAGLDVQTAEIIGEEEDGELVSFLWVLSRRPGTAPGLQKT